MIHFVICVILVILHCGFGSQLVRQYDVSYGSPAYKHCVCGRKNYPLLGDIRSISEYEIEENEYPWIALITGNDSLLCSGTLINDRYIVTVVHLLQHRFKIHQLKVILGENHICQQSTQTVIFSIEKIIEHPEYNSLTNNANIMLIKLNMRVTFNEYIRPICLPPFNRRVETINKYSRKSVTALGWRSADVGSNTCNQHEVQLEIFQSKDCEIKINTIFCAGIYGNGPNACNGETGSPLHIVNNKGKYEFIGITLRGFGCGSPGFYTDVPKMVPWIMKITTRDSMYCWR